MTIRPPSRNTCAECWKYRNELGVILCQENMVLRNQFRSENDGDEVDKLDVETENLEGDDNNNTNTSNNQVENYPQNTTSIAHESTEDELCPPFAQTVESIVSKFKVHVDQYLNMQNLVKTYITKSRQHETDNVEWSD